MTNASLVVQQYKHVYTVEYICSFLCHLTVILLSSPTAQNYGGGMSGGPNFGGGMQGGKSIFLLFLCDRTLPQFIDCLNYIITLLHYMNLKFSVKTVIEKREKEILFIL
jgi:hypothetical protein